MEAVLMFCGVPIVLIAIMLQLTYVCTHFVMLNELLALSWRPRGWKLYASVASLSALIGLFWQYQKIGLVVMLFSALLLAPIRTWLFVKRRYGGQMERHVFYRFSVLMCTVISVFTLAVFGLIAIHCLLGHFRS